MNPEIRKKAAIWLALVFILGTATGGVCEYSLARRSYAATKTVAPSEAEHRAKKVADMTDAIGLTAEQAQKAEGIIKNAQSEIRTILTPEQLPKFEQYIQRMDEQRKKQKEAQQVK